MLADDELSSDSDSDIEPDMPPGTPLTTPLQQFTRMCILNTRTHTGLDGAAFASRMPANKMTQQECEFFYDIARGSQSAVLEFLFIRNKLLSAWLADPTHELTGDRAQSIVLLPQAGRERVVELHCVC